MADGWRLSETGPTTDTGTLTRIRRTFLSEYTLPNFGGPAGADLFCSTDPNRPVLGAEWKVMIGSSTRLWAETDANAIFTDYRNTQAVNQWTGLNSDWQTPADLTCSDWTATTGNGRVGWTQSTSGGTFSGGDLACTASRPLIGIEQAR